MFNKGDHVYINDGMGIPLDIRRITDKDTRTGQGFIIAGGLWWRINGERYLELYSPRGQRSILARKIAPFNADVLKEGQTIADYVKNTLLPAREKFYAEMDNDIKAGAAHWYE